MRRKCKKYICAVVASALFSVTFITQSLAATAKKADLGAISGFSNSYTSDDKGNYEIGGAMVAAGTIYNISVEDGAIQAWCDKYKGGKWKDKQLIDLLNQPTTFFYEKVSGNEDTVEFTNKVEFTRPNGKSY